MIRAVLYDLGDVFFEAHHWRQWMHQALCDRQCIRGSFAEFYWTYERVLQPVYEGRRPYEEALRGFVNSLGLPDPDTFVETAFARKVHLEKTRTLYDGVMETLDRLQQNGVTNVVVSDNEMSGEQLRATVLDRYDLNPRIAQVVTSFDAGVRKPHPAVFAHALQLAGCSKSEAVFVGHDADELTGAREYG
ncbi:HAD hydrolase-like protein, partial [candidate division GN15 bacterium]|nr:HAD hydrolase-like protein [candidate division GN15 bacterium]